MLFIKIQKNIYTQKQSALFRINIEIFVQKYFATKFNHYINEKLSWTDIETFAKTGSNSQRLDRAKKQISVRILHVQRAIRSDCVLAAAQ